MTEADVKSRIRSIGQKASTEDLRLMLDCIGSTDSGLRDQLIYTTFGRMFDEKCLDDWQVRWIAAEVIGRQLLVKKRSGCEGDDVFTRSFSVLLTALLFEYDRLHAVLDEMIVSELKEVAFQSLREETDFRGYVDGKGWAHAVAHGADLIGSIVRHPSATEQDCLAGLGVIARFLIDADGFRDEEEERLARALLEMPELLLLSHDLLSWLEETDERIKLHITHNTGPEDYYPLVSWKQFLQSVYFISCHQKKRMELQEPIREMIVKLI